MGMLEYGIMALVYITATWLAYSTGHRDGFSEGISVAFGVDTKRTLH